MPKGKIFTVSLLWLFLILFLSLSLSAHADNSCSTNIPTNPGNVVFPANWKEICADTIIAWDDTNSATPIARNDSRLLKIIEESGTGGSYIWSVSGTGFSLGTTEPTGTSNILYANGTACGSATIKVRGCTDKTEAKGYVRSTSGKWFLQPYDTPWPYAPSPSGTIIGKYKLTGSTYQLFQEYMNEFVCQESLEICQDTFAAHFNDHDGSCSNPPYVLGCTNVFNFTHPWSLPGEWPKYWTPCKGFPSAPYCKKFNAFILWYQSQFRVSIWECP